MGGGAPFHAYHQDPVKAEEVCKGIVSELGHKPGGLINELLHGNWKEAFDSIKYSATGCESLPKIDIAKDSKGHT